MILRVFDFWPFTMEPGPGFLVLFVGMCVVVLGAAYLLAQIVGRGVRPERASSTGVQPTSAGTARQRAELTIGEVPRPEDADALALLRGGRDALAEALLSRAVTQGWLVPQDGNFVVLPDVSPKDAAQRILHDEIGSRGTTALHAISGARAAADRVRSDLAERLRAAGLLRKPEELVVAAAWPVAGVVILWLFAIARIVVRDHLYGEAPLPTNLLMTTLAATAIGGYLVVKTPQPTPLGRRYLAWVRDVTVALRQDVQTRQPQQSEHVPLVVALDGIRAVGWLPLAVAITPILFPPMTYSGGSSCSSSSCSSGCGGGCGGGCS